MAKSAPVKFDNSNKNAALAAPRRARHWGVFFACLFIGVLLTVALLDYSPEQRDNTAYAPRNLVGTVGVEISSLSFTYIGLSTWLLPVFLFWMTWVSVRNARLLAIARFIAMLCCIFAGSGIAAMAELEPSRYFPYRLGGAVGELVYTDFLKSSLGVFGAGLLLAALYCVSLTFIFTKDIVAEFEKVTIALAAWRERRRIAAAERAELRRQTKEAAEAERAAKKAAEAAAKQKPVIIKSGKPDPLSDLKSPDTASPPAPADATGAAAAIAGANPADAAAAAGAKPAPAKINRGPATPAPGGPAIVKPEETKKAKTPAIPLVEENYQFPPLTLLVDHSSDTTGDSDDEYKHNMDSLVRVLGEFGVTVSAGEIHVGPVITCYEVVPAPGVRVEKIANLDKNIALNLRAQSVRILAPIPGKAAVGIEMPNRVPAPVGMRDILESVDWVGAKAEIPIALGKDVSGRPLISDLTRMPHLLIAGATGSGKSVCINSIIASIVYRKSPKDIRLIMVDPKVVELKIFNTLPHMLIPVVTEPKKVPSALKWLLAEMEKRYKMFGKVGVRNISGFNHRKKTPAPDFPVAPSAPGAGDGQAELQGIDDELGEIPDHLPYIVIIIDELADLMMVAAAEIETSVARLAQLARAAGIHLIIATQRPSVNVITGIIKANLPSRIAFQVASQVDSRTILDGKGADTLIGRGDMLFTPPGTSRLVRAQGAFVSDEEVAAFVEYLKRNGPPQYAQDVQETIDDEAAADMDDEDGEDYKGLSEEEKLYKRAFEIIKTTRRASTSTLQRRLRIGYNRAARIMDQMEENGIVGPENGSSPRDILIDFDSM
ncbi:DNA translocase FtsK [Termitidicoccus mucosus]|uniref:Cell division protein FtsK n=1 Tax=Termitidicoccus mucosus TaxID=1184151 RepID=A0A178II99_9BACT|nr:cell division protein FtsK [Opitutaceae bacterium TSB47]